MAVILRMAIMVTQCHTRYSAGFVCFAFSAKVVSHTQCRLCFRREYKMINISVFQDNVSQPDSGATFISDLITSGFSFNFSATATNYL